MKSKQPKYKPRHSQAEKDYFKSIADQVRAKRLAAITPPANPVKGATPCVKDRTAIV